MLIASAPAKINLFLHVLRRRSDGYHELQSLIAFASFADEVRVADAQALHLSVDGPMAHALAGVPEQDNLVLRAARLLRERAGQRSLGADVVLTKNIPAGAGFGGGSGDAAATLTLLRSLWRLDSPDEELQTLATRLGADVPVCIMRRAALVEGIGERIGEGPWLPDLWLVLAHTGVPLATALVFKSLKPSEWTGDFVELPRRFATADDLARFLVGTRNDLEMPALRLQPKIADLLAEIASKPGCMLARMSGSGSGCFGLFASQIEAFAGAEGLRQHGYWAAATLVPASRRDQ